MFEKNVRYFCKDFNKYSPVLGLKCKIMEKKFFLNNENQKIMLFFKKS